MMANTLTINEIWKIPELGITVDPTASYFPFMPETIDSDISISGEDGEINLSTTYGARNFELVGYSCEGLNSEEKEMFKRKIARFLHKFKNEPFRLAIKPYYKSYDVKYSGALDVENYPMSVKVTIPLKSVKSFGYKDTQFIFKGEWTEESDTDEDVGFICTIQGPTTNELAMTLNDTKMALDLALTSNEKAIINTKNYTVTKIAEDGTETNILKNFTEKKFPKIVNGKNTFKILSGITDKNNITIEWYDLVF